MCTIINKYICFRVMKILYWKPPIYSTLRKITKSRKNFRLIWNNISELPLKGWISKMMKLEKISTVSSKNSRTRKSPISSQKVIQYSSTVFIFSYVIYYIFKSYRFVLSLYKDGIGKRHLFQGRLVRRIWLETHANQTILSWYNREQSGCPNDATN